jgi:hypothetical protein
MHKEMHKRERWVVSRIFASWNQLEGWLRQVDLFALGMIDDFSRHI